MNRLTNYFVDLIIYTGKLVSLFWNSKFNFYLKTIYYYLYTGWISTQFKSLGSNSIIKPINLIGGKHIEIGKNCSIGIRTVLSAWDCHNNIHYNPQIIIGDNVSIGTDCHITSINKIVIGNNVLTGKFVTITDNAHGESNLQEIMNPPSYRKLFSKGIVTIGEGVWIGDKVTILPNVNIGNNAIIAANSVVNKDVPENSIFAGIPAKQINLIK